MDDGGDPMQKLFWGATTVIQLCLAGLMHFPTLAGDVTLIPSLFLSQLLDVVARK